MSRKGRPIKHDGVVFSREDSRFLSICYWDKAGKRHRESTFTEDRDEANKKLRERLQARDGNILQVVRKGENLIVGELADWYLENYSKPPIRALKTHIANLRATKHLKGAFATRRLVDVTADDIEHY